MRRNYLLLLLLFLASFGRLSAQATAFFTASDSLGCPPLVVHFTNQSTGTNGSSTYNWDLGNGNSGTGQTPSAIYPNPGAYDVKLVVTTNGVSDSFTMVIRVFQPPTDSFTSISPIGCADPCHMDSFINLSQPGNAPLEYYAWDFGDSTLADSSADPTHCYAAPGHFTIILVVRDTNGCESIITKSAYETVGLPPTATVSANDTQTCNTSLAVQFTGSGTSTNGAVSYQWFFGPGQGTSGAQDPSHTFPVGVYNPYLVVTDGLGCRDTASINIAVTDVQAAFGAVTTEACTGLTVQFNDSSNFANSWSWTFGDGGSSTLQNPTHIYTTSGTYSVTLTVHYGPCVGTVTRTNYVHVTPPITFNFSGNPTSSCSAPLTVNFTNNAVGGSGYLWVFGDGDSSTLSTPTHVYTSPGTYTVSLSVANASGCVNTVTEHNYIVIALPAASVSVDSFHGCTPVSFSFSSAPDSGSAPIVGYQWVFGDGNISNLANVNHTFTTGGDYLPMLIITSSAGCKDTIYVADSIKVGTPLIPDFTASPLVQCVNQPVNFTNLTLGTSSSTIYKWEFGDGQTSNQSDPTHIYSDTGQYTITLEVINQGCMTDTTRIKYILIVVPKADFTYSFACNNPTLVTFHDTSQGAQTWVWEFGDGDTSHAQNPPPHQYDSAGHYTITLIVTNSLTGCTDSDKQTLSIGASHVAFGASPQSGCETLSVNFTDSSVNASSWWWNFGDGNISSNKNPNHLYQDTGRYSVTLVINPGSPCSDTLTKVNYITVYGIIGHPVANPPVGCSPLTVSFTDSSTSYMGTINSWKWHFGVNNDSSSLKSPVFTYNAPGNYTATLDVTDSHGCSGSFPVHINSVSVIAYFTSDTIVCPGEACHFTNLSQGQGIYLWQFGDGTTSIDTNPTHAFTTSGYYYDTLIAISTPLGCRDTFISPVPVHVDTPIIDFTPSSTFSQCPPFPVQFTAITNRTGLKWMWYFGDGDTSTSENPFHIYIYPGYYTVTLVGTDSFGCSGSKTYVNLIQIKGPIGHFQVLPTVGCVPLTVNFTGTTQSTASSIFVPGPGAVYDNQIDVSYTYNIPGEFQPIYTLTDSFGCTVPYVLPYVIVGSYPYQNLPPDTLICKGNYAQLTLPPGDSLAISEHFIWTSNLPQSFLSCDTCPDPVCMSPDTITYYITSTSVFASNGDTATCVAKDTITVNADALPEIFPGIDFRICPNDTLQLHAGPNVTEAVWSPDQYISDTSSVNPKAWPPDTTVYRVTGTNAAGCSISRIVTVLPITKVVAEIAVSDTTVCAGSIVPVDVVVLQASFNDTSYLWSPDKYLNSPVIQDPTADLPPGDYTYQVIVSSRHCISDTATMHVVVSSAPDLEAGTSQIVAYGTVVQLYAASHQNVTYTWTPSADSFSCLDCRRPFVTVDQSQTVYVTAVNDDGCKTTDSVELKVVACDTKMIFVPNTFTPNGDGLNDVLYVRGAGLRELEYFRVYDRWGNLVFQTNNLSEGWDGRIGGHPADIATYAYVLRGICSSGSTVDLSGNVTLVR